MSLFNQEELAMIAIGLDEEEADDQEDLQQTIKRIWVCGKIEKLQENITHYARNSQDTLTIIMITSKCQNLLFTCYYKSYKMV
ncbi:unnamed protein product [Pieris brassicae]|uniref:Uncharacterized protein n=1 Tax=Pieris brassicae TaxID=7116 RepID=A0A9P0TP96_PIEBR|nr:unnamed protein product [Pieris brassicae]